MIVSQHRHRTGHLRPFVRIGHAPGSSPGLIFEKSPVNGALVGVPQGTARFIGLPDTPADRSLRAGRDRFTTPIPDRSFTAIRAHRTRPGLKPGSDIREKSPVNGALGGIAVEGARFTRLPDAAADRSLRAGRDRFKTPTPDRSLRAGRAHRTRPGLKPGSDIRKKPRERGSRRDRPRRSPVHRASRYPPRPVLEGRA